jgi:hypothetical protein
MKTTQSNMLASLRNVQAYLKTNASALASVITTGTNQELDGAIVTLGGHASNQSQTFIEAKGATQTQESLRKELLQFHMAPINRIAKLKLSTVPELASFLMPRSKLPIQTLKGFADGMAAAAAKYSATFIAAGLPIEVIVTGFTVLHRRSDFLRDRGLYYTKGVFHTPFARGSFCLVPRGWRLGPNGERGSARVWGMRLRPHGWAPGRIADGRGRRDAATTAL